MKRFIAFLAASLCANAFAVVPAELDFTLRPWERPEWPTYQGPVVNPTPPTPICGNPQGNVFQTAYSGMYANPSGSEVDLWITGNDLVATVRLGNGHWLEGAITLGAADRALYIPLVGPDGSDGQLTLCASWLTQNVCSRFDGALIIDGQAYSPMQTYTRNRTPANNPICVQ